MVNNPGYKPDHCERSDEERAKRAEGRVWKSAREMAAVSTMPHIFNMTDHGITVDLNSLHHLQLHNTLPAQTLSYNSLQIIYLMILKAQDKNPTPLSPSMKHIYITFTSSRRNTKAVF